MSTFRLGILLRNLSFLGVAGAAGFALGRGGVGASTRPLNDYELFRPLYEAPAATEHMRWHPSVVPHRAQDQLSLLDYPWPDGSRWEPYAPASAPRQYFASPVILPSASVFPVPGATMGADPSPPSPPTVR